VEIPEIAEEDSERPIPGVTGETVKVTATRCVGHFGRDERADIDVMASDVIFGFNAGLCVGEEWYVAVKKVVCAHLDSLTKRDERTTRSLAQPALYFTDYNYEAAMYSYKWLEALVSDILMAWRADRIQNDDVQPILCQPFLNPHRDSNRIRLPECAIPMFSNCYVFGFERFDLNERKRGASSE
jgi:hypothetical protein